MPGQAVLEPDPHKGVESIGQPPSLDLLDGNAQFEAIVLRNEFWGLLLRYSQADPNFPIGACPLFPCARRLAGPIDQTLALRSSIRLVIDS
jgi:hypothetical protein